MTARSRVQRLLAVLAVLVMSSLVAPGTAAAADPGAADQALPDFGACLRNQHHGDLLVLIDSSSSLQQTDPANNRVVAARLLLARLADVTGRAGITMDVAVAGFDATLTQAAPWTALTGQSLPSLEQSVAGFSNRNQGFETDYWTALTRARLLLAAKQAGGQPGQQCQAMLLFTDGQYVLSARTSAADIARYGATKPIPGVSNVRIDSDAAAARVAQAGRQDLCRPGGVADQIRVDGITTIAVGLASTASSGTQDFSLLSKLAVNPDNSCGKQPGRGLFLPATDVNDLVLIFDRIASLDQTGPPSHRPVCQLQPCPQSAHTFTLDPSIDRIHLVGTANVSPIGVWLQLPGQPAVPLRYATAPRQLTLSTTTLTVTWYSQEVIAIDASYGSPSAWSGTWSLTFVDLTGANPSAISAVQLTISGDLAGQLTAGTPTASEPADLRLDLVREDGSPAELGSIQPSITADITAAPANGSQQSVSVVHGQRVTATQTPIRWDVPADFPAGDAILTVVLHVRTLTGLQLLDQTRQTSVTVKSAPGIPVIGPARINFGTLQGTKAGHARITFTGSGCVWLKSSDLTVFPQDAGTATVTSDYGSSAHCLAGRDGGSTALPLTLQHPRQANGQLQGSIVLGAAPAGQADRASSVTITFTASLERLPNQPIKWLVFAICLIVGLGVPVLVLAYLRYRAARLPAGAVQSVLLDVTVDDNRLTLTGGSSAEPSNWIPSGQVDERRKAVSIRMGVPVEARVGLRLDQPGYAVAMVSPMVGCGSAPPHTTKDGLPTLPLELGRGWAFFTDQATDQGPMSGRLLLVAPQLATASTMAEVLAKAQGEVPSVVARCRSSWPRTRPPEQAPPTADLSPSAGPGSGPQWGPRLNPDDPYG